MRTQEAPTTTDPYYNDGETLSPWRESLNTVIFGSETPMGKAFDVVLSISIVLSVIVIMLDSVEAIQNRYAQALYIIEWLFTLLFTLEYGLRLISVRRPGLYFKSFFGLVDLISILPSYLILLFPGTQAMLAIRILRLLRVFRILKLSAYMDEAEVMMAALHKSSRKIMVFLYAVFMLVIVFGSLVYVVESREAGFTSIPRSVYWAIVTLTTVGYGDISPQTPLGQLLASAIMIMGYGIIAVPTGIYSAELIRTYTAGKVRNDACPACGQTGHDFDADYCKHCGHALED
ncbi:ion transporter [Methylobacter tundripaludum]|uniref:Ion transport protein n=1 Tax=Methylobacter tundripaludum (strain ATCC BAA-1195 / DSM 17260 / SV96) TaxID=697282 RepID=G3IU70_METTV|nr:ion transporter [Methylobacter tundripaludum]EGW22668.1 Ion transport protein [Methylobacter tundripaludum SV96]